MAGHSKWANIQHRKGKQDAKRGKIFTRLIKEITVAARLGGGDPDGNPRLRLAMDKAYANNMPKDNVERAIKRGSGELDGVEYQELRYEGYGINGAAVMVDCMTDNKTRTVADVRHAFTKYGGNLGTDGSVSFLFKHCGQMIFAPGTDENGLMEVALDAGAEDIVSNDDGSIEVITAPHDFVSVKQKLEAAGYQAGIRRGHHETLQRGGLHRRRCSKDAEAAGRAGRSGRRAGSVYNGGHGRVMKKVQGSRLKIQGTVAERSKDSHLASCPLPLASSHTRILGIDPGLRVTGFGVLDKNGQQLSYVASGCIRTPDGELPERLKAILDSLGEVIALHQPQQVAVEKVFVNVNPQSTLSLGQARGAAICAAVLANLPVSEYTALQVKQAVVGNGHADKEQVQQMVQRLLKLSGIPGPDAADALA